MKENLNRFVVKNCRRIILLVCFGFCTQVNAVTLSDHPKLQSMANELIAEGIYAKFEIESLFSQATIQSSVIEAIQNPAEYKFTWGKYRKLFLQQDRIEKAVEFWREHEQALLRAEAQYGVPVSIILAIIGVESKYGVFKGKHKVLDSLVSLVTGYPRRSDFFAGELKHFLILTKENQMDAVNVYGSYAGAVGYPQFISSSYRNYAVDFSGDGKTDLIDQPVDAIGSIANYFVENGWLTGQPITSNSHVNVPSAVSEKENTERKILYSAAELRNLGAPISGSIADSEKLNVLKLDINEEVTETENGIYIVRAGDTACEIAERYAMTCRSLFEANKLNSNGTIYRGQRLKVAENKPIVATGNSNSGNWTIGNDAQIENGPQYRYFFTHENFYVITRYNHSVLYAMAVNDLSVAIDLEKQRQNQQQN